MDRLARWARGILLWLKNNAYIVAVAVAFGLLGATEQDFFSKQHPHWQIFFKEVAFAMIIAAFFGLTIERYQREEFVKLVNSEREDLKRDIFLYAYGHMIPEQIREEIKESILKEPFYRERLRIEWEFSAADDSELLILEKKYTYVLQNNTGQQQRYIFKFTQISAAEKEVLVETQFDTLKIQLNGQIRTFGQSDMRQERPGNQPHVRRLIKDFEIHANKSAEIYYAVTERRRRFAEDMYAPRHPVVGQTRVLVRVSPPLQLEVSASCKARGLTPCPDHDPPRCYSWRLDEGLLPFQGIAISWSPVSDEPQEEAGEAPA